MTCTVQKQHISDVTLVKFQHFTQILIDQTNFNSTIFQSFLTDLLIVNFCSPTQNAAYLNNKALRIHHPDLLNGILFTNAFFTHGRNQQVSRTNGSLPQTQLIVTKTGNNWIIYLYQKVIRRKLRLFGHICRMDEQQKNKDPGVQNDGWFKQKRTTSPRMVRWHWAVVWGNPAAVKPRCPR